MLYLAILQFAFSSSRFFYFCFFEGSLFDFLFNLFWGFKVVPNFGTVARVELWVFSILRKNGNYRYKLQHVFFSRLSASIDFRFESNWSRQRSEFECLSILNFLREPFLQKWVKTGIGGDFLPCVPHGLVFSKQQVSFLDSQFRAAALGVFLVLPDFPLALRYVRRGVRRSGRVLFSGRSAFFWRQNERILVARICRFSRFFRPVDLEFLFKMRNWDIFTFWMLTI